MSDEMNPVTVGFSPWPLDISASARAGDESVHDSTSYTVMWEEQRKKIIADARGLLQNASFDFRESFTGESAECSVDDRSPIRKEEMERHKSDDEGESEDRSNNRAAPLRLLTCRAFSLPVREMDWTPLLAQLGLVNDSFEDRRFRRLKCVHARCSARAKFVSRICTRAVTRFGSLSRSMCILS